jgi:hypothetical protein
VDDNNVWVYTMTWNAQRPLAQDEIDAMLQLARDMQVGRGPEHAGRAEAYRVRSTAFVVEPDTDWENSAAEHMKALV